MANISDIEKLITIHKRRLQILKERQAYFGISTPPEILLEVEDIEATVQNLQEQLETVKTKNLTVSTAPKLVKNFSFLRQWKPDNEPNGFGADILLEDDFNKEEIISLVEFITRDFVKYLKFDKEPILIRFWTSQIAYEQNKTNKFGKEFREGYIAFYVRNLSGKGAYSGFNELRWMQEIGKFSDLFGEVTLFIDSQK